MFRGGGDAGGGKKGKKHLEYVKPTPKFLSQMKEQIVKQENDQIQSKITTIKKIQRGDREYDLENATIANPEEKQAMIDAKKQEHEINLNELNKDFKPTFQFKSQKNPEKKTENDEKIEEKQIKNQEILGKRKALTDYVDGYLKEGDQKKYVKSNKIEVPKQKKVKTNLLSFEN